MEAVSVGFNVSPHLPCPVVDLCYHLVKLVFVVDRGKKVVDDLPSVGFDLHAQEFKVSLEILLTLHLPILCLLLDNSRWIAEGL